MTTIFKNLRHTLAWDYQPATTQDDDDDELTTRTSTTTRRHYLSPTRTARLVMLLVAFVGVVMVAAHIHLPIPLLRNKDKDASSEVLMMIGDPSDPCSCWNSTASLDCCQRVILRYHKMGTRLMGTLVKDEYHLKDRGISFASELPFDGTSQQDFRAILTLRNFYEAIVSGYLYHKSGRECWLTTTGEPKKNHGKKSHSFASSRDWETLLQTAAPLAPSNNRNVCEYLRDESERDGLRVIMELLFVYWWQPIKPYWEQSHQPGDPSYRRVYFVCYEDLVNNVTEYDSMQRVVNFLFPAKDQTLSFEVSDGHGAEGHATSTDPDLRHRLRSIIEELDRDYFNHIVAWHQQTFQCGE